MKKNWSIAYLNNQVGINNNVNEFRNDILHIGQIINNKKSKLYTKQKRATKI